MTRWRTALEQHLRQAWLGRGLLARLLWPLSQLYAVLLWLHRRPYLQGQRLPQRLPVPVLVVGNVLVGGTGKTPTVMAVVQHLLAQGWQPGVLSRGHGRAARSPQEVQPSSNAADVGDEPLLIALRTGVPVVVGRDRPAAARHLLQHHPHVNVLVSDDGMQHWALARDLTLVLFDQRGCGNGWLLPAGPLREPWPTPPTPGAPPLLVLATHKHRQLASLATNAHQAQRPLRPHPDANTAQPTLAALAGIAQPERFFDMLRQQGCTLQAQVALHDHADGPALLSALQSYPDHWHWLCTEKDAVKLFPLLNAQQAERVWSVALEQALPNEITSAIDARLKALSSRHGQQTS